QRIGLRCRLRPFSAAESAAYIATRLARAGMREQTAFPPDVLLEIHKRTQGIPRLINLVSDNLLLTAFAMEKRQATVEMLDEVTRDMELNWPGNPRRFEQADKAAPPAQADLSAA
ncbi:MAG TPA: hypothetical protein VHC72_14265, partial [Bryobacteraceae bacterium]|nr:hypothetical protein [Bryobacteraceae bacterium]